jgi:uncharacterized protein (DUF427 family)
MADHITIRKAEGTWAVRAGIFVLGESADALELREGSYPPVIYFPRADLDMTKMARTETSSTCPWKGQASYYTLHTEAGPIPDAAWSYESPKPGLEQIAGHLAFYPAKVTVERI